jgi:hypothetical protein
MTTLIEQTLEVYRDALGHLGLKLSGESASLNQLTPSADETVDVSEFRFAIHRSYWEFLDLSLAFHFEVLAKT